MEAIFEGETAIVRKHKDCCRCGKKTEVILPEQYWKRFQRLKGQVVCPECLKVSESEEEREMYAQAPANLYLMQEELFIPIKDDYSDYLKSEHWQETRKGALERAKHRCQLCNSPDNLHVHHRTYQNIGNEKPEDLIALCRGCHYFFHKRMSLD